MTAIPPSAATNSEDSSIPVSSESIGSAVETSSLCRHCGKPLEHLFTDLGASPLCESFLSREDLVRMEPFYPLRAFVCDECFLVQVEDYVSGENIFGAGDYAYFSSYSDSWLAHAKAYVDMITPLLGLDGGSQVVELASNDGYLLQNFVQRGIPALGIEPASNVAEVARSKGVEVLVKFFGTETASELVEKGTRADLLLGNNVLAHVPDINDFVAGMKILLADDGVITMEFPHLMRLIERNQFDTIYQEHYSYLSLYTVGRIFASKGLKLFDVEEIPTHGGSIRIYGCHEAADRSPSDRLEELKAREAEFGITDLTVYRDFHERVIETKHRLVEFLIQARREGKRVAGYGAPGKGNTLLNYCGVREDLLEYVVDRNPVKHGKFLPGTRIPVHPTERIAETRPDYVLILPWNLKDEITEQLQYVREWGARFVVPIPELSVFP